jgi:integrase
MRRQSGSLPSPSQPRLTDRATCAPPVAIPAQTAPALPASRGVGIPSSSPGVTHGNHDPTQQRNSHTPGARSWRAPRRPGAKRSRPPIISRSVRSTLVLLACFAGLRWGELVALRRRDIDIGTATVRITRQLTEVNGQAPLFTPPKTAAGRRIVVIPAPIWPAIEDHLEAHAQPGPDGLLFTSPAGKLPRHSAFRGRTWIPAVTATRLTGVHFHGLRHAGNNLVADAGANLRELMERMGHASSRAAPIYLHPSPDRAAGARRRHRSASC